MYACEGCTPAEATTWYYFHCRKISSPPSGTLKRGKDGICRRSTSACARSKKALGGKVCGVYTLELYIILLYALGECTYLPTCAPFFVYTRRVRIIIHEMLRKVWGEEGWWLYTKADSSIGRAGYANKKLNKRATFFFLTRLL